MADSMYYNIGDTPADGGITFIYAQTNDAFNKMEAVNTKTGLLVTLVTVSTQDQK